MKRILYASGEFFTDDAVAVAVMDYASVLAIVNSADVVTIPGIDDRGIPREISLIIGPASQIMAMGSDEPDVDLDVGEALADLRRRSMARLPNSIGVAGAGTSGPAESDAESTTHEDG
jgi:hypothetical protein